MLEPCAKDKSRRSHEHQKHLAPIWAAPRSGELQKPPAFSELSIAAHTAVSYLKGHLEEKFPTQPAPAEELQNNNN